MQIFIATHFALCTTILTVMLHWILVLKIHVEVSYCCVIKSDLWWGSYRLFIHYITSSIGHEHFYLCWCSCVIKLQYSYVHSYSTVTMQKIVKFILVTCYPKVFRKSAESQCCRIYLNTECFHAVDLVNHYLFWTLWGLLDQVL